MHHFELFQSELCKVLVLDLSGKGEINMYLIWFKASAELEMSSRRMQE